MFVDLYVEIVKNTAVLLERAHPPTTPYYNVRPHVYGCVRGSFMAVCEWLLVYGRVRGAFMKYVKYIYMEYV